MLSSFQTVTPYGDWVIDPGSEGPDKGGEIVVAQHPLEPVVV